MRRRRIWCELVAPDALTAPSTIALLHKYRVDPILAVWPDTIASATAAAARFTGEGLAPAIWPMLSDADGRWIGAGNAGTFAAFVERVADELDAREIAIDVEPPVEALRASIASRAIHAHVLPAGMDRAAFVAARDRIRALVDALHARGRTVSAAVVVPALLDRASPAWQERLGTPVDGIAWDHVSPMLYTSIFEGWSHGLLARPDARALLAWSCREARARFGAIAGASLGAIGPGAFGDEQTYRSPAELADDVAIARAAGLDDLALFDLGGALARPPAEAWLEAFVETEPLACAPEPTPRSRATIAAAKIAGAAMGALARVKRL